LIYQRRFLECLMLDGGYPGCRGLTVYARLPRKFPIPRFLRSWLTRPRRYPRHEHHGRGQQGGRDLVRSRFSVKSCLTARFEGDITHWVRNSLRATIRLPRSDTRPLVLLLRRLSYPSVPAMSDGPLCQAVDLSGARVRQPPKCRCGTSHGFVSDGCL